MEGSESAGDGTVDAIEAMNLMRSFRDDNPYLDDNVLSDEDLMTLESEIEIIRFEEYEELIGNGEMATWLGFIFKGEIDVLINMQKVATLKSGQFVGDFAVYEGGKRSADCIGGTGGGIIGVMRFAVLDTMWERHPRSTAAAVRANLRRASSLQRASQSALSVS